jgi:hypothetical protein
MRAMLAGARIDVVAEERDPQRFRLLGVVLREEAQQTQAVEALLDAYVPRHQLHHYCCHAPGGSWSEVPSWALRREALAADVPGLGL